MAKAAILACKLVGAWQTTLDLMAGMSQSSLAPSEIVYEAAVDILERAGIAAAPPKLLDLLSGRAQTSLAEPAVYRERARGLLASKDPAQHLPAHRSAFHPLAESLHLVLAVHVGERERESE